jgi:predicted nucleic acid-binding protein
VYLVDTSVWIGHFRQTDPRLVELLENGSVTMHDFVLGELACGTLSRREEALAQLEELPRLHSATEPECRHLVETNRIWALGLGWVDVHLLGAALINGAGLYTLDRSLRRIAERLGVRSPQ